MNVANRKLFTNRDARAKLSSMGGIMASSPELLGEVQKFAKAGEVKVPERYVIQIPGLIDGNEFLEITGADFQAIQKTNPELIKDGKVTIVTPELLSELNPAQIISTDNPSVQKMFADLGVALPQEQAPVSVGNVNQEISQSSFLPMNTAADSTDPLGVLTNPRTDEPMTLLPPQERSPQVLDSRSGIRTLLDKIRGREDPQVATESPGFLDSDAGQEISPEMAQELKVLEQVQDAGKIGGFFKGRAADAVDAVNMLGGMGVFGAGQVTAGISDAFGYLGGGGDFSKGAFNLSDTIENATENYTIEDGRIMPRLYNPDPSGSLARARTFQVPGQLSELDSEQLAAQRAQIQAESLAALENADASVFSEGAPTELTPAGRAQRAADSVTRMSEQGMPKGLSPEAIERIQEQQAQETIDRELDAAGQRLVAGQPIEAGPFVPSEETVTEERTTEGQTVNSAGQLVDADGNYVPIEENLEVMPGDLIAASGGGQEEVVETDNSELAILARENASENARVRDAAGITRSLTEEERTARLAEAKEERALRAADSTTKMSEQGPNFVFDPTKIQEEIDKGGSGSDSIIGDLTGTNQNLTPKESVKAYQAIFKEIMGIDDEDKEKEKYHQMAMIGFAVAAGKSDNALENVAVGLLEGTKLARKDRKDKKTLMSKVNMAAFDAARQDTRDAAKYTQQLDLADTARRNRLDETFLKDFRVQKNAHLKLMGDTKIMGQVSDPQQMSRDAAKLAFQDMYQMYGKDSLLNSSLYATNKGDIDMAIGAVDAGQKYLRS